MNKLITALSGLTTTKNGALAYKGTGSAVLDFYTQSGAMRQVDPKDIINKFKLAFEENPELALKALFYSRDVRGGQGERNVFRIIISYLAAEKTDVLRPLLPLFPEYGRWDDLLELALTPLEQDAFSILRDQLSKDLSPDKKNVSLAAKWTPSENASSGQTKLLATRFRKFWGLSSKDYRKSLSHLRKTIKIVESDMCSGDFDKINYEQVPSGASLRYRKAFSRHDGERYVSFLGKVKKGEAKVNVKTLFPYELISPFFNNQMHKVGDSYYCTTKTLSKEEENNLDVLWGALPNYLGDEPEDGLVVVDTSGSMRGLPIQVAVSLGLYYAERNKGAFNGHFITFSEKPELQAVKGATIGDRVRNLASTAWNKNTNLQAVFNLVLDRAVAAGLKQEDMPSKLYIVSDMQFDAVVSKKNFTNLEVVQAQYQERGFKVPEIIFWQVNAAYNNSPVKKDDSGIIMVSGASGQIFKQIVSSKAENPYEQMLEVLLGERYSPIIYQTPANA